MDSLSASFHSLAQHFSPHETISSLGKAKGLFAGMTDKFKTGDRESDVNAHLKQGATLLAQLTTKILPALSSTEAEEKSSRDSSTADSSTPTLPAELRETSPGLLLELAQRVHLLEDLRETLGSKDSPRRRTCVGRSEEIRNIFMNLMYTDENNHVFVYGPAGIGKTTLLHAIAQEIIDEEPHVPKALFDKRLYLVKSAGTGLCELIANKFSGKVILFVDEVQQLFGSKKDRDSLKPLLSSNKISLIGVSNEMFPVATMGDSALMERFTEYTLPHMSREYTTAILMQSRSALLQNLAEHWFPWIEKESRPEVQISAEAIELIVLLSDLFGKGSFPRKAQRFQQAVCAEVLAKTTEAAPSSEEEQKSTSLQTIHITAEQVKISASHFYRVQMTEINHRIIEQEYSQKSVFTGILREFIKKIYSIDAQMGKIPPVYGRTAELSRMLDTLSGGDSIMLTGAAGQGKSHLVMALAQVLLEERNDIPQALKKKQMIQLDVQKFMGAHAATQSTILRELIKHHSECILVVDECAALLSGSTRHIFKDALALGEIQMIAITTHIEYSLITDSALLERFDIQTLEPLTPAALIEIFKNKAPLLQENYARTHKATLEIDPDAYAALVFLALKYFPNVGAPRSIFKLFNLVTGYLARHATARYVKLTTPLLCKIVHQKYEKPGSALHVVEADLRDMIAYHLEPRNQLIPSTSSLIRLTTNLTHRAARGDFSTLCGRQTELLELMKTLANPVKNNIVLLGSPGVGKTTLAAMLAQSMIQNDLHGCLFLRNKLLLSLDINTLNAFNIEEFLKSAEQYAGLYLLFVDEVSQFLGGPFFDRFKPALANGTLRLIGATTEGELHSCLTRMPSDGRKAFERRFHRLPLSEMSIEDTTTILSTKKTSWEKHYSSSFGLEVAIAADCLSFVAKERAGKEPPLPDGACALVEAICSESAQAAAEAEQKELTITTETAKSFLKKQPDWVPPSPPPLPPSQGQQALGTIVELAQQTAISLGLPSQITSTITHIGSSAIAPQKPVKRSLCGRIKDGFIRLGIKIKLIFLSIFCCFSIGRRFKQIVT